MPGKSLLYQSWGFLKSVGGNGVTPRKFDAVLFFKPRPSALCWLAGRLMSNAMTTPFPSQLPSPTPTPTPSTSMDARERGATQDAPPTFPRVGETFKTLNDLKLACYNYANQSSFCRV